MLRRQVTFAVDVVVEGGTAERAGEVFDGHVRLLVCPRR
jgi:hypothetical protein